MTITGFLAARYDERMAVARAASPGPWHTNAEAHEVLAVDDILVADGFALSGPQTRATTQHIALNDPSYVLADITAKRAIVERLVSTKHAVLEEDCWYTCAAATVERDGGETCDDNRNGGPCDCGRDARVEGYLALLAQPFADHPDYDESWKP